MDEASPSSKIPSVFQAERWQYHPKTRGQWGHWTATMRGCDLTVWYNEGAHFYGYKVETDDEVIAAEPSANATWRSNRSAWCKKLETAQRRAVKVALAHLKPMKQHETTGSTGVGSAPVSPIPIIKPGRKKNPEDDDPESDPLMESDTSDMEAVELDARDLKNLEKLQQGEEVSAEDRAWLLECGVISADGKLTELGQSMLSPAK